MPGLLAVAARDIESSCLNLTVEALGPLVAARKSIGVGHLFQFTNPKFLGDKVFQDDADVCVALDGVIFNFAQLQREYGAADYFGTVKALYGRLGDEFFKAFRGEFAGVLYDKVKDRWVVFTNHTASKPMFYYRAPGLMVCSTDFDAISQALRGLGRPYSLDIFGAYCLLTYGYMLEDVTLMSEVRKLKAGHYLTFENDKVSVREYVRFQSEPYWRDSRQDVIANIDALFKDAVVQQYEKDREYGYEHLATLSGGMDSRMGLMVSYELGYRRQVALTFSQTGFLDALIAGRIASDLKMPFIFYSLDNGHYLEPLFRHVVRANGGLNRFSGSAHQLAALASVNMTPYGILHMGQVGDAVLGSFLRGVESRKAEISWGANSSYLADRIAGEVQKIINGYATEDEFLMYNRGFNGAVDGTWITYQFTECTSPFLDRELLAYAMRIPRHLRYKQRIYLDWVLARHPQAARYTWTKTKAKPSDPVMVQRLKWLWWAAGIVLRRRWHLVSMNPLKAWLKDNPELREFTQRYWDENASLLNGYPELKKDAGELFRQGGLIDKTQVMTLLAALRKHFA